MQENILEDSQEKPKTSLIRKILTTTVLTGALFMTCGCEYMIGYSRGPRIRTYPRSYFPYRYNYPSHMRGTFMDPFPPGRRGYQSPRIIQPHIRIGPRRPFNNSPYGNKSPRIHTPDRTPSQRDRKKR